MKVLATGQVVEKYPYSDNDLRSDNPQVSFPRDLTDSTLATYGVYPVGQTEKPAYNSLTQNLTEGTPVHQNGQWVQVWVITEATTEEIAEREVQREEDVEAQRAYAYRTESDPLFFKYQRNEATQQEWLDKVAEIKARYPD